MIAHIRPALLSGTIPAIASKSVAHRLIIVAALANGETRVRCNTTCNDIDATIRCLTALGARIERDDDGFTVRPMPKSVAYGLLRALHGNTLDCGESGSTLRFLLPVACALGPMLPSSAPSGSASARSPPSPRSSSPRAASSRGSADFR